MRTTARLACGAAAGAAAAHLLPSVLTVPQLHRLLAPRLSGQSRTSHVALTFDDGPHPVATPLFLDLLADLDAHATFFLLGSEVERYPSTAREIVERGHEVAVHATRHVPHLLRTPPAVVIDVDRAYAAVLAATGHRPRFWRPPNGVLSGTGLAAALRRRLRPVLWTADGQDWRADATPAAVVERVARQLQPGGTVLLHDSDITSASGSWRTTLAAVPGLVRRCRDYGWQVGPLREHWGVE